MRPGRMSVLIDEAGSSIRVCLLQQSSNSQSSGAHDTGPILSQEVCGTSIGRRSRTSAGTAGHAGAACRGGGGAGRSRRGAGGSWAAAAGGRGSGWESDGDVGLGAELHGELKSGYRKRTRRTVSRASRLGGLTCVAG